MTITWLANVLCYFFGHSLKKEWLGDRMVWRCRRCHLVSGAHVRAPGSRGREPEQWPPRVSGFRAAGELPNEIQPVSQSAGGTGSKPRGADPLEIVATRGTAAQPKVVAETAAPALPKETLELGVPRDLRDSIRADQQALPEVQPDAGGASGRASPPLAQGIVPAPGSVPSTLGSRAGDGSQEPSEIGVITEAPGEAKISDPPSPTITDPVMHAAEPAPTAWPPAPVEAGAIRAKSEAGVLSPISASGGQPTPPMETGTGSGWTKTRPPIRRARVQHPTRTQPPVAPTVGRRPGTSVAPENRGGRPRGPSANPQQAIRPTPVRRVPPALVCWRIGMLDWCVGLGLPSDRSWCVRQGDNVLEEDSIVPGRYALEDPLAPVVVNDPEGMLRWSRLPVESFRAFRLTKKGTGRRALAIPAANRLLVVVPGDWSREPGADEPEPAGYVFGGQWRAHHFRKGAIPAFRRSDGTVVDCLHFRLVGSNEILDDRPRRPDPGPLFVGEPPELIAVAGPRPARVVLIAEDTQNRCWNENWDALRHRIRERAVGRFSARIYDSNDFKVQVLPFRYSAGLRSLTVESSPPAPGPEGHAPARISFHHEAGCRVSGQGSAVDLEVDAGDETSTVSVAPDPLLDHTEWRIAHDRGSVSLGVRVDRMWWSLSDEDGGQKPAWTAGALSLAPSHFAPTSPCVVRVRLPRIRSADRARIGFHEQGALDMERLPKRREMRLPLRNLGGCAELQDAPVGQQVALQLWWWCRGPEPFRATVGVVEFPVERVAVTEPDAAEIPVRPPAPPRSLQSTRSGVKVGLLNQGDLFTTIHTRRTGYVQKHEPLSHGTWVEFDNGERKLVASNVVVAFDSLAPVVAGLLTRLRRHGSRACRELVRHVRADWRGSRKGTEGDFVIRALCVLAVVVREEEQRGTVAQARLPQRTKWLRRADAARRNRPDIFADIEQEYRVLAGEGTQYRRGSS